MSDLGLQPREEWKELGRLPAEGRLGSSENPSNCLFLLPALPSVNMCHLFGIRSVVSLSELFESNLKESPQRGPAILGDDVTDWMHKAEKAHTLEEKAQNIDLI
jgi:hypothetical protein